MGVLHKSVAVLDCVAAGERTLGELVDRTGLSRATAHRLALGLEQHGLLRRTPEGRFALGLHLLALGRAATDQFPLAERARTAMEHLRDATGESVQLYVTEGSDRVCVAALESPHGLRTIVQVGAVLSMEHGSAAHVLSGEPADERTGWVESIEERERGVASVSAPVLDGEGRVLAAVSVSGPVERMGPSPGEHHGAAVAAAAQEISALEAPGG